MNRINNSIIWCSEYFWTPDDWVVYTIHETLSFDLDLDLFKAILFSSTLVSSTITVIQTVFFNIVYIYIYIYIYIYSILCAENDIVHTYHEDFVLLFISEHMWFFLFSSRIYVYLSSKNIMSSCVNFFVHKNI